MITLTAARAWLGEVKVQINISKHDSLHLSQPCPLFRLQRSLLGEQSRHVGVLWLVVGRVQTV